MEHERGPGLLKDTSEAPQVTGVHSLSQPRAQEVMDVIEQNSTIYEASSHLQDFKLEVQCKASLQASLARFSGPTSNP